MSVERKSRSEDVEKTEGKKRIEEIQRDCVDLRYEIRTAQMEYGQVPRVAHYYYHCGILEYHNRLMPCVIDSTSDRVHRIWGADHLEEEGDVKTYTIRLVSGRAQVLEGLRSLNMLTGIKYEETVKKDDMITGSVTETKTHQDAITVRDLMKIHDDLDVVAHELGYGSPTEKNLPKYEIG